MYVSGISQRYLQTVSPVVSGANRFSSTSTIRCSLDEYAKSDREGYTLRGKLWGLAKDFIRINTRSVGGFCSTMMTVGGGVIAALGFAGTGGLAGAGVGIGMSLFGLMTGATVARSRLYDTP